VYLSVSELPVKVPLKFVDSPPGGNDPEYLVGMSVVAANTAPGINPANTIAPRRKCICSSPDNAAQDYLWGAQYARRIRVGHAGAAIYDASGVFLEPCQCIGRIYGLAVALRVDLSGMSQDQLLSCRE